ncbi:MAG: helix-turn-helix domain-containing protein [Acidobacteriota bacterium]
MNFETDPDHQGTGRWPPWSRIPSIKEMVEELGIDYDQFTEELANFTPPEMIASRYGISDEMAANLVDHFMQYGVGSVSGGD